MATPVEGLSVEELCNFLVLKIPTLSESVMQNLKENKVDGDIFMALNEEYLQEIAPY